MVDNTESALNINHIYNSVSANGMETQHIQEIFEALSEIENITSSDSPEYKQILESATSSLYKTLYLQLTIITFKMGKLEL